MKKIRRILAFFLSICLLAGVSGCRERTEEGTQGRVEAIRRINNEYGKYLPNLLSERSSLNELDAAYRTVTEAIKEHTAAKMRSQAIEKIAGESIKKQADALTKMRDISKGVLGQERGSAAMDIVQSLTEDFLKAGDVLDLGHPTSEPIHLYIGGKRWFDGKMGVQNNSMAVKIVDTCHIQERGENERYGTEDL